MRIAILVTNTDDSAFAHARPLDDAKFAALIHGVRPDWACQAFWVCKDDFPDDISLFDGVMITGSPASVNEHAPWMLRLAALVRQIVEAGQPLFGACFGHQIIAQALGRGIMRNPDGWAHGRIDVTRVARMPWSGTASHLSLYGSHIEQVDALPDGAVRLFESPGCPIAGFAIGDHVATVQHHPEMTHAFISDLVDHYADATGPEVTARARASLEQPADNAAFAAEIAAFFEHATAHRRTTAWAR